jgi:hypothetical protein
MADMKQINRRDFFATSIALSAGAAISGRAIWSDARICRELIGCRLDEIGCRFGLRTPDKNGALKFRAPL